MSSPFIGEIRMFAGNFAPAGWMFCEGQLIAIADNNSLFILVGTTYGGDGVTTFALPDLRGRLPIHMGTAQSGSVYIIGEQSGVETVTLTASQIPAHSHPFQATTNNADSNSANNNLLAQPPVMLEYFASAPTSPLSSESGGATGGSQPHSNFQSYLCVNFIISLFGIFPSRT
jgi:microcystin-dependent protein